MKSKNWICNKLGGEFPPSLSFLFDYFFFSKGCIVEFTFFWKGLLSQWSHSPFKDKFGVLYSNAEQYMMAQKAKLFKDTESYEKILKAETPSEQKALGRLVKNFNDKIWLSYSTMIVYEGNILKFKQNKIHYDVLMSTKNTILVEASPFDPIWGIKLTENDPRSKDMRTWLGQNRLGFILTKVRDDLREV